MRPPFFPNLFLVASLASSFGQISINEIDSDTPGSDTMEFVELFNGGNTSESLDGYALVFFNGGDDNDSSYLVFDLSGQTIDAGGFFVIGNPGVTNAQIIFEPGGNGALQNGADAVALYLGTTASAMITAGTGSAPIVNDDLVDAIVYETGDPNDDSLLGIFGGSQLDESLNGNSPTESIQRNPDGSNTFSIKEPTPGTTNFSLPVVELFVDPLVISEADGNGASFLEIILPDVAEADVTFDINISDNTEISADALTLTIDAGDDAGDLDLNAVDDSVADGDQVVTITVSASGFAEASISILVTDDEIIIPPAPPVTIAVNEARTNATGDDPNFVELYNTTNTAIDIAGWTVRTFPNDPLDVTNFGTEITSFSIPGDSPVLLPAERFFLAANDLAEEIFGVTGDVDIPEDLSSGTSTLILFDELDNIVYSVFFDDGEPNNVPNNAGNRINPSLSLNPDGGFPAAGFFLIEDGGSEAGNLAFGDLGSTDETPGSNNSERFIVEFDSNAVSENAGNGGVMATVTRVTSSLGALSISALSSDTSRLVVPNTLQFAEGEESISVPFDLVDNSLLEGLQSVTVTISASGFSDETAILNITDDEEVPANIVINEVLIDTDGADTEFLELYNADSSVVDLAGYSIERWESDIERDPSGNPEQDGEVILLPSIEPILLSPGNYFLIASAEFAMVSPIADIDFEVGSNSLFENSSATFVLRNANGNILHTVFATDGGADDFANINGVAITPDVIANDSAWALSPDGSNNAVSISNARSDENTEISPGVTNGETVSDYSVAISDIVVNSDTVTLNFDATGNSDIYVSTDLEAFVLATDGDDVATGSYTDSAPPTGSKAFYLIQEAGAIAP